MSLFHRQKNVECESEGTARMQAKKIAVVYLGETSRILWAEKDSSF